MSDPSAENEQEAWRSIEKAVDQLYTFYLYAKELEEAMPALLTTICLNPDVPVSQNSATVKLLARMFHFAFHFDELKMNAPMIQNDFSYYRRVVARMKPTGGGGATAGATSSTSSAKKKTNLTQEEANKMSFHYAYPTPVMKVLIGAAVQMSTATQLVPALAEIGNAACQMGINGVGAEDPKVILCLMTGCIILVDHVATAGAFHKKTPIRIKQCITLLQSQQGTEMLLNPIRFSTLHFTDDTTPPAVSKLLNG